MRGERQRVWAYHDGVDLGGPAMARVAKDYGYVACQGDGTTSLSRAWDHLGVSVSITGLALGVNGGAPGGAASLPVGGAFDDQGVCA